MPFPEIQRRGITGSELAKFVPGPNDNVSVLTTPTEENGDSIVDVASSVITYVGYADYGSLTSAAVWRIKRIFTQGSQTITTWADSGKRTQVWDDRAALFETPDLLTTLSLGFDGINDYVNFGNAFNYDTANQFSVSIWGKQDNQAAQMALFGKVTTDAGVNGWSCQVTTAGRLFYQMRSGGAGPSFTATVNTVPVGSWFHTVMTYAGGSNINGLRSYLNSVVDSTPGSSGVGAMLSGQDFRVGLRGTGFPWSGNMCHMTVWGKALSAAEVLALYNGGTPGDPTALSFAGDLVTWCKLGDGDVAPVVFDSVGTNTGTLVNMTATPFEADVP